MSDEWGPWIEHDGKGLPDGLRGQRIRAVFEDSPGDFTAPLEGIAGAAGAWSWDWQWWGKTPPGEIIGVSSRIRRYQRWIGSHSADANRNAEELADA